MAITCFFAASYVNADINRYYLGPVLMAWTWLAILAAVVDRGPRHRRRRAADSTTDRSTGDATTTTRRPRLGDPRTAHERHRRRRRRRPARPDLLAAPARYTAVDLSRQHDAQTWVDRALKTMEPESVVVSWWSYSTPLWYAQRVRANARTSRSSTTGPGSTRTSAG